MKPDETVESDKRECVEIEWGGIKRQKWVRRWTGAGLVGGCGGGPGLVNRWVGDLEIFVEVDRGWLVGGCGGGSGLVTRWVGDLVKPK